MTVATSRTLNRIDGQRTMRRDFATPDPEIRTASSSPPPRPFIPPSADTKRAPLTKVNKPRRILINALCGSPAHREGWEWKCVSAALHFHLFVVGLERGAEKQINGRTKLEETKNETEFRRFLINRKRLSCFSFSYKTPRHSLIRSQVLWCCKISQPPPTQ